MKTQIILTAVTITALLFINPLSYGQGCHGGSGGGHSKHSSSLNSSPYGGAVKQVGRYTIEMVYQPLMKQDPLMFYLMNIKGKSISNQQITGKAEIAYADGSIGTITLTPRGENGFAGQMVNKTGSFTCLLTLTVNGKDVTARFDGGVDPPAQATYTCPMHPEVQTDRPGSCPKCGMALEKSNN